MTNWYRDIFPCSACNKSYMLGGCTKGHDTTYVDGCRKCGKEVNTQWYFDEKNVQIMNQNILLTRVEVNERRTIYNWMVWW